jgi:hypothetical protein
MLYITSRHLDTKNKEEKNVRTNKRNKYDKSYALVKLRRGSSNPSNNHRRWSVMEIIPYWILMGVISLKIVETYTKKETELLIAAVVVGLGPTIGFLHLAKDIKLSIRKISKKWRRRGK